MKWIDLGLAAIAVLVVSGPTFASGNLTLLTQERRVSGQASAEDLSETVSDSDSEDAMDAGPFVTGASAQAEVEGGLGSGGGTQDSTILTNGADITGSAFATGESFDFDGMGDGSGLSRFEISFSIASASTYTLTGELSAFDSGETELRFLDSSGLIFDEIVFGPAETRPINRSGSLAPGDYTLFVHSQGSAFGSGFASEFAFGEFALVFRVVGSLCEGDIDGDGDTDVLDFGLFAGFFGTSGHVPCTNGDIDGDGDVDVLDFGRFGADFGCTP